MRRSKLYQLVRLSLGAAIVASPLVLFVEHAEAWNSNSCKMDSASIDYYIGATYNGAGQDAVDAWNRKTDKIQFYQISYPDSADVQITTQNNGNNGHDGDTYQTCSGGSTTGMKVAVWNTYYTSSYSGTLRKSVMVHELGHVLGLAHAGSSSCSGQPIMYYSSDRYNVCGHQGPQPDDLDGVSSLY